MHLTKPVLTGRSAVLCALALLPAIALRAQPTPPAAAPAVASAEKEEILQLEAFAVTGSNIKRLDQEKVLPVTIFSKDLMESRNAITPVEMLTALPQVTNVPLNETTSGGANSRGDNANVNLRGIGSGNTLVLLNGRRLAPHPVTSPDAGALSFSVNVNQLPTRGLDHIDVLRDGASSVYGSDAVAGVINYITRKDFRGTELTTRYGRPEHGGGQSTQTTLTYGMDFADGKGRWLTTLDYLYRDPIYFNQRDFTKSADHSALAPAPFNVVGSVFDGRSTTSIFPSFRVGASTATTYFRPVNGNPAITTTAPTRAANPEYYLNVNQYQNLGQTRSDRVNFYNNVEYDLNDRVTAFADISYYHSNSALFRQPLPLNAPSADSLRTTADPNNQFTFKIIAADNPYNPYGSRFYSPTGAPNADGTPRLTGTPQTLTLLTHTIKDDGPEHIKVASGIYRVVGGARGKFGDAWTWESGALYTRAYTHDDSTNAIRESLFGKALQRTDATAYNPFGYTFKVSGGAVVADQPYTNPGSVMSSFVQLWRREGFSAVGSLDFRTSGPLVTVLGRTVSLAAGGEYRKEQFQDYRADYVGQNPAGSGLDPLDNDYVQASPKPNSAGDRTVGSAYTETVVPLFAPKHDVVLLHSLELTASARYERYSDFGSTTKPKFGVNWKPFNAIMIRASYNRGFTAPNLPTLYAPTQFTVDSPPGSVDLYRQPYTNEGAYVMRNYSSGNPNLKPVNSEGKSAGIVIEVPKIKGLSVTADFWQLDQTNVIGSYSTTQIMTSDAKLLNDYTQSQLAAGKTISQIDLGSGTANYKGDPAVVRNAPSAADIALFNTYNAGKPAASQAAVVGTVISRSAAYQNLAKGFASGWDLGLNYQLPKFSFGKITLNADWAYLIKTYQIRNVTGAPSLFLERMNVDGTTRWRGTGGVTWRNEGWSAGVSGYYVGSYADGGASTTLANYTALGAPSYLSKQFDSGSFLYRYRVHDVVSFNGFVSYRFQSTPVKWLRRTSIRLGVVNLTDKEPPLVSGAFGYSGSVHNTLFPGRTWSLEITKQF